MSPLDSERTSLTLIRRVREQEADAWEQLVDLYSPLIYGWSRRAGLQENDTADVLQDVFQSVSTNIGGFGNGHESSSFRGWLWAITRNRIRLHYRQQTQAPQPVGGLASAFQQLPQWVEQPGEPSTIDERRALLHRVLRSIEADFSPQTWRAFWAVAMDGRSAVDVADELRLQPSTVRQAKYRVLCRLQEEMR